MSEYDCTYMLGKILDSSSGDGVVEELVNGTRHEASGLDMI
jgi:hypothetical protein